MAHILLVDDEEELRAIYKRLLEDRGHLVEQAAHGREALDRLAERAEPTPDVILLDYEMPELSGLETVRALRARGAAVPVVLLTAHAEPDAIEACLSAGAQAYITKPLHPHDLIEELDLLLHSGELGFGAP